VSGARRTGGVPVQILVDAGNTRLKACLLAGGRLGREHAQAWAAGGERRAAEALLRALRRAAGRRPVSRVLACSVAGAKLERALRAAARTVGLPAPLFIRSSRHAGGVRNGYADAWRLGADRFIALVGACALHPGRALCLVDAGTALTIDLVDATGRHRGGLLVPGPELMVSALLGQTAGIRRRAGRGDVLAAAVRSLAPFGRSTRAGLASGALLACAALIERAAREARATLGAAPLLLLSGGAAAPIATRLKRRARLGERLVFAGLAVLAAPSTPKREAL
jgi:type III pantothenate kinase